MKDKLLEGAYDLHIHLAPDIMERKLDDIEMAKKASELGMAGFALKSHYFCTSERAEHLKKLYPDVDAIGAITLNNSVGGINPIAVDMAGRSGAQIVWMPTVDSQNEQKYLDSADKSKLPHWAEIQKEIAKEGIKSPKIRVIDDNGNLKGEVLEVLDVIKKHDMTLATSHLDEDEVFALVKAAEKKEIEKIIVTHPNFPSTFIKKEKQLELVGMGVFIEHCFTTPETGKVKWEVMFEQIKYVGPKNCILATDLGQPKAKFPFDGLRDFITELLENGFTEEDIDYMIRKNPRKLIKKA